MFSYILVVSRVYILLISICLMLKIGKLPRQSSYILAILFKSYFKGAKIWWLFAQLYQNSTDCFVLEVMKVDTMRRFQNRICINESQEKKNKILYKLKKWELLQLLSITQNPKRYEAITWITHKLFIIYKIVPLSRPFFYYYYYYFFLCVSVTQCLTLKNLQWLWVLYLYSPLFYCNYSF